MSTAATVAEATSHLEPLISDLGHPDDWGSLYCYLKNKTATCFRLFDWDSSWKSLSFFPSVTDIKVLKFGQRLVLSFYYLV
jgi:hypothetical protein